MKILILGGTRFLGRHLADAALARGHEVTLFNRGLTNPGLFPEVGAIYVAGPCNVKQRGRAEAGATSCGPPRRPLHLSADGRTRKRAP